MLRKRILTIQDISCVGQCSMTIALPVLSVCGHETCVLPTALLSTHTGGFSKPHVLHLGDNLEEIRRHWQREGIVFDAIYTGYIGSTDALDTVLELVDQLLKPDGELIVDPAMADHGKLYSGLTQEYAAKMAMLCRRADILLPNVTEAAMLSGLPPRDELDGGYIGELLQGVGCPRVVLTGVGYHPEETGIEILDHGRRQNYAHKKYPRSYHGTGDLFASCFVGLYLRDKSISDSARIAADMTFGAITHTWQMPDHTYGLQFEKMLPELVRLIQ